jgi:hypothetical protein
MNVDLSARREIFSSYGQRVRSLASYLEHDSEDWFPVNSVVLYRLRAGDKSREHLLSMALVEAIYPFYPGLDGTQDTYTTEHYIRAYYQLLVNLDYMITSTEINKAIRSMEVEVSIKDVNVTQLKRIIFDSVDRFEVYQYLRNGGLGSSEESVYIFIGMMLLVY